METSDSMSARFTTVLSTRRWAQIQAWSGILFALFTSLHLFNTALAAWSPSAYDGFQRALRPFYQQPAVELLLLMGPLGAHLLAGFVRIRRRRAGERSAGRPPQLRTRVHRYSGYFLAVFILGHIAATRGPALLYGIHPEFAGVAFTLRWVPLWFYPYYSALALAGLFHLALGLPLALATVGVRVPLAMRRGWLPRLGLTVAAGALLLGMAGFAGWLYEVPDPRSHPFAVKAREITSITLE